MAKLYKNEINVLVCIHFPKTIDFNEICIFSGAYYSCKVSCKVSSADPARVMIVDGLGSKKSDFQCF